MWDGMTSITGQQLTSLPKTRRRLDPGERHAQLLEHAINVAFLLVIFGKHLDLDVDTLKQIAIGGVLHDIGKVKIDDKVLHKPHELTPEEFEYMKLHQIYINLY